MIVKEAPGHYLNQFSDHLAIMSYLYFCLMMHVSITELDDHWYRLWQDHGDVGVYGGGGFGVTNVGDVNDWIIEFGSMEVAAVACYWLLYPSHTEVVGGYMIGFTTSIRPSFRLSVHLSRILCPLCRTYCSGLIHFIFILQKVCRVWSFLQNIGNFLKFVTLTLSCFDLGFDMNR